MTQRSKVETAISTDRRAFLKSAAAAGAALVRAALRADGRSPRDFTAAKTA